MVKIAKNTLIKIFYDRTGETNNYLDKIEKYINLPSEEINTITSCVYEKFKK
jgi:hypothetical protein